MPIWIKNKPIYFQGEMANKPWAACGTVSVEEVVIPLADVNEPIQNSGIVFYPFLRADGSLKWFFCYRQIADWRKPVEYGFSRI